MLSKKFENIYYCMYQLIDCCINNHFIILFGVFKWKDTKHRKNKTCWNWNMPFRDYVAKHRGTRFNYLPWLCEHMSICIYVGEEEASSYVFHPIDAAVHVRKSWLSYCKIRRLRSSKGSHLEPGAVWNLITSCCSSVIEYCNGKGMMSS